MKQIKNLVFVSFATFEIIILSRADPWLVKVRMLRYDFLHAKFYFLRETEIKEKNGLGFRNIMKPNMQALSFTLISKVEMKRNNWLLVSAIVSKWLDLIHSFSLATGSCVSYWSIQKYVWLVEVLSYNFFFVEKNEIRNVNNSYKIHLYC